MPTESARQPRQLVTMAFILVAMATLATELTLASPGQAILPRLALSLALLGWAFVIYTYLRARARRESSPSLLTMVSASILIVVLWGFDITRAIATTERLAPEILMVVLVRAATLTVVALAGNAVCLRISGGLSVALMLFASVLTEHRAIYGITFAYALLGSYWLILLYWSQIQVNLLEGRSRRPPILATTVWGVATGLLIVLVVGPSQTIGVLAEWLGMSGGTTIASPDARGGVGDGQDLASGTEKAKSTGPVESDIFLETQDQSLYDAANEKWGKPEKPKKREQSLAVALANKSDKLLEEKSRQPNPAREFSVIRKRRRDQSTPSTIQAHAAYFVKGKTPLHIRLAAFHEFDGERWLEPAPESATEGLRLGFGGWILMPSFQPSVVAGDLSHKIVVGSIDAPQIPLPPYAHSFRIDLVDRPDFFRFSRPGILIYRTNTALPRQTVLEARSHTIDPEALRGLRFPSGRTYALSKFLTPGGTGAHSSDVSPNDTGTPSDPRIIELASSWVGATERGWRQVEAVVRRLRQEYVYDPEAELPSDASDAMSCFLFERRRGDDYAFATAACLLLRSLGYPSRFVEGLYAQPRRLDPKTQQTPILMPGDLHTWVEVMLPTHEWVVVEPTPGFEVLGPERGLLARICGLATRLIGTLWNHPQWGIALVLVLVGLIRSWRSIGMGFANFAWRLEFRGTVRDQILATVRLLERRARLAGRRRPLGVTLRGWYRAVASPQTDEASHHALFGFFGMAEWALYGPQNEPVMPGLSDDEVESRCREFVRMWPATRLTPMSQKPGEVTRRRGTRGLRIIRLLLLAVLMALPYAARGQAVLPRSEKASSGTSVPKAQFPDLPQSVWAEQLPPRTEQTARGPSVDVKRRSQRTDLSKIPGVEDIPDMSTAEHVNEITMQAMTALFFFVIGACVGSFLNVVVYRLPRRMKLSGRKSHCPICQVDLSFRENMPIVGWLRLRGRCLACRAPISIRYPLVEVITGLIFLTLLQVELLSGGKSIPIREPNGYAGVVWIIWYPKWDLIALYLYHCFLVCTLLCVALIRKDGQPVPSGLLLGAALVGVVSAMILPSLHPVPAIVPRPTWFSVGDSRLGEVVTAALGLATGVSLGALLLLTGQTGPTKGHWRGLPVALGLAGLYLGWQAAVSIALLMAAIQLVHVTIGRFMPAGVGPLAATFAAIATFVQITCWRALTARAFWPSHTSGPGLIGASLLLLALLSVATRFLQPRSPTGITMGASAFSREEAIGRPVI
jgi:protein-glutamine gamma-glutamyltransferase